jgi:hypothetical protein
MISFGTVSGNVSDSGILATVFPKLEQLNRLHTVPWFDRASTTGMATEMLSSHEARFVDEYVHFRRDVLATEHPCKHKRLRDHGGLLASVML